MARTKQSEIEINLLDAVASAVLAHELNGGYCKDPAGWEHHSYATVDADGYQTRAVPNVAIMMHKTIKAGIPLPKEPAATTVQEKHILRAKEIIAHYQNMLLQQIAGDLNEFEMKAFAITSKPTCTRKDLNLIACFPNSYQHFLNRSRTQEMLERYAATSQHIGDEGGKFAGQITIVNMTYVKKLACYLTTCVDEHGNLIAVWGQSMFGRGGPRVKEDIGRTMNVTARIKRHGINPYHGGKETIMNYMKVVNAEV